MRIFISFSCLSTALRGKVENGDTSYRNAVDAVEKALLCKSAAVIAKTCNKLQSSLLERLISITGKQLPINTL